MFNVLFVGYSLAKNNLNSTYQYNMIPKKNSKTMNYLKFKVTREVSRFLCRSVYLNSHLLKQLTKSCQATFCTPLKICQKSFFPTIHACMLLRFHSDSHYQHHLLRI
jgi:hypothetical protein